jgi:hydrogenase-4 component B
MGLFLLYHLTGTLAVDELAAACAAVEDRGTLWAAAVCLLFGFGAKAGVFPLHIWLPKAHPVAPAPASALLSGILTKSGIFGILLITARILPGDHGWGNLILVLGAVTMVLGAVMAVFSNNLKYILACSSLSQIGFILLGVAMICLLGEENALAAHGTVLYMMNHSLVKLTLFLFAGVVYYSTHELDLNRIRGFGRGRPLLHALFLCGACSLAGVPGFCGYLSKTLVHEAIVEYAAHGGGWITAVEWLFLFSGGLTAAYLAKIYVAVFWQDPAPNARHHDRSINRWWGTPLSVAALCLAAVTLPALGLLPHALADRLTDMTLSFTGGHPFPHPVAYFSPANLKGVAISLGIGMAVYFLFIRRVLMVNLGVQMWYRDRWPEALSLEEGVYKPVFGALIAALSLLSRALCDLLDLLVLLSRRTFLRDSRERAKPSPFHLIVKAIPRESNQNEREVADQISTMYDTASRISNSLSFALAMTCLGLCIILVAAVCWVFL